MNVDTCPINVLSVCSGVGGLDLGLRLAMPSSVVRCYVENEAYACGVLAERMEEKLLDDAPVWTDIRTFDGKPWRGIVQVVIGGYPCSPFSRAGKRRGKKDSRHLWPHVRRIVGEIEPDYCFFENVEGHLDLGFEQVRDDLLGLGFRVEAGLFAAEECGGSHRRKRLFILACHERTFVADPGDARCGERGCDVADAEGLRGSEIKRGSPGGVLRKVGQDGIITEGGKTVPFFPPKPYDVAGWRKVLEQEPSLEPAVFDMADELAVSMAGRRCPNRLSELRVLGNGVVPVVAALGFCVLFARALARDEREKEEGRTVGSGMVTT
jgi:DNA (cytosine-5)-methyltransferase 1